MYPNNITFTRFDKHDNGALAKRINENKLNALYLELDNKDLITEAFTDLVEAIKTNTSIVDLRIACESWQDRQFPIDAIEAILSANAHIQCVGFHYYYLSGQVAVNIARRLKKFPLRTLDFTGNSINAPTLDQMLMELSENKFLSGLILSRNEIRDLSDSGLVLLLKQNRLVRLEVSKNPLSSLDYTKMFNAIASNEVSDLETLNISFTDQNTRECVGDSAVPENGPIFLSDLRQLHCCKKLKKLYLNGCKLLDDSSASESWTVKDLLEALPALECFDLRYTGNLSYGVVLSWSGRRFLNWEQVALGDGDGYSARHSSYSGTSYHRNVQEYNTELDISGFECLLKQKLKTLALNNIHFNEENFRRFCAALAANKTMKALTFQNTHLNDLAYMQLAEVLSSHPSITTLRIGKVEQPFPSHAQTNAINVATAAIFLEKIATNATLEVIDWPDMFGANADINRVEASKAELIARNLELKKTQRLTLGAFFEKVGANEDVGKLLEEHGESLLRQAEVASPEVKLQFAQIILPYLDKAYAANLLVTIPASSHVYAAACFALGNAYYTGTNEDFDFASDQERLERACLLLWEANTPAANAVAGKVFLQLTSAVGAVVSPQEEPLLTSVEDTAENNLKLARILREKNTAIAAKDKEIEELKKALKRAEAGREVKPVTPTFFGCAR